MFVDVNLPVFLIFSLLILGFICILTGKNTAENWKNPWMFFIYAPLIGCTDRFFVYALFNGILLDLYTYMVHTCMYLIIMTSSYRLMLVHKMVKQYPWIYEKSYFFFWREKE